MGRDYLPHLIELRITRTKSGTRLEEWFFNNFVVITAVKQQSKYDLLCNLATVCLRLPACATANAHFSLVS